MTVHEQDRAERSTRLLTVSETAEALHVGRTFAWQLIATGRLPTVRLGRLVRVRPADLASYLDSLAVGSGDSRTAESTL